MRKIILTMLLVVTLCQTGCQKEDVIEISKERSVEKIIINDDILHFSSQQQFNCAIENYKENNVLPEELNNFKSLAKMDLLKSSSLDEEEEDELVPSDLLKEFLNDKREIIVNDIYCKITSVGTILTKFENKDVI